MSKVCQITGKKAMVGNNVSHSHSRSGSHSGNSSNSGSAIKKRKNITNDDFITKLIDHLQNGSIKFPSYSGDIDIDNYKKQCNIIATQNNWSDQILATQIVANLKGDARKLLSLMPKGQETDLNAVWLTLSCNSPKNEVSERAKNMLNSYRQLKGQSLLKLALEIKRLASEAYPNTDQATRDELAVDAFTKAIHNHNIRFQLRISSSTKTVDEARVLAEKIESAFTNDRAVNLYHINHSQTSSRVNSECESDTETFVQRKRKADENLEIRNNKNNPSKKNTVSNTPVNIGASANSTQPPPVVNAQRNVSYQTRHVNFAPPQNQNYDSNFRVNQNQNHSNDFQANYNHYSPNYSQNPYSYPRRYDWRYRNFRGRRRYDPFFNRNNNQYRPQNPYFSQDPRATGSNYGSRENLNRQSNAYGYQSQTYQRNDGATALNEQRQQN